MKQKINPPKTRWWAFASIITCSIFTSFGILFWKIGAERIRNLSIASLLTNMPLIVGTLLYAIGAILLIVALKGGELSVIQPFISLSYVFIAIISVLILSESLNTMKIAGMASIIIGIIMLGVGSR